MKGFSEADAIRLVQARAAGYRTPQEIWQRAGLGRTALEKLARADAFHSLNLDRRKALWQVRRLGPAPLPLFGSGERIVESPAMLPMMPLGEHVLDDYDALGLSMKRHPVALLRPQLAERGAVPNACLLDIRPGRRVKVAGLVLVRQRPGSAKGIIFMTIEDETAIANLIVWPPVFARLRPIVLKAGLICAEGRLQREDEVIHIVIEDLVDMSDELARLRAHDSTSPLKVRSRDFH